MSTTMNGWPRSRKQSAIDDALAEQYKEIFPTETEMAEEAENMKEAKIITEDPSIDAARNISVAWELA